MTISKEEATELYDSISFMRDKIIQAVRIKYKFDERRAQHIDRIKRSLKENTIPVKGLEALYDVYTKERKFFHILEDGIDNINSFENKIDKIARQVGIRPTLVSFLQLKKPETNLQNAALIKYAYKKVKKYHNHCVREFERVQKSFTEQYGLLGDLLRHSEDASLLNRFLDSYNQEVLLINNFYKTRMDDKMMKLVKKLSLRQAIVLIVIWNLPASGHVTPIAIPFFGLQYAIILGVFSEIIKWSLFFGYTTYTVRKQS